MVISGWFIGEQEFIFSPAVKRPLERGKNDDISVLRARKGDDIGFACRSPGENKAGGSRTCLEVEARRGLGLRKKQAGAGTCTVLSNARLLWVGLQMGFLLGYSL